MELKPDYKTGLDNRQGLGYKKEEELCAQQNASALFRLWHPHGFLSNSIKRRPHNGYV